MDFGTKVHVVTNTVVALSALVTSLYNAFGHGRWKKTIEEMVNQQAQDVQEVKNKVNGSAS